MSEAWNKYFILRIKTYPTITVAKITSKRAIMRKAGQIPPCPAAAFSATRKDKAEITNGNVKAENPGKNCFVIIFGNLQRTKINSA